MEAHRRISGHTLYRTNSIEESSHVGDPIPRTVQVEIVLLRTEFKLQPNHCGVTCSRDTPP